MAERPRDDSRPLMRLRFRIYVDGKIADESWVGEGPDTVDGGWLGERHRLMCQLAEATGRTWVLEVFDPTDGTYERIGPGTDQQSDLIAGMIAELTPLDDEPLAILIVRPAFPPPSAN